MKMKVNETKNTVIPYRSFWNMLEPVWHGENTLDRVGCVEVCMLGDHRHSLASLL